MTDSNCALMALTLLSIPHDVEIASDLEPVGWLLGPHLIMEWLNKDWFLALNGQRLNDVLNTNPWLIVTDSVVQLAIGILRIKCEQGTPRESKIAKHILQEIGLELFIPERIKTNKNPTKDITLQFYSNNPDRLVASVRLYEFVIKKYWDKKFKRIGDEKKKEYVGEAFKLIFKKNMPVYMREDLKKSTRINSTDNAAIALIEYETNANYESLRSAYYKYKKICNHSEIYANFDLITDNKGDKLPIIAELKRQYIGG